ncbi:hypothetical protein NQ317_000048 [Molorchus minor]|uniref:Uncharacterized protein n=1 Tax=Molorchus minor TaxID=1323400 RepID=A0ABQ9IWD1_9CUCU|nr:hypothetical protein NQ317_000048 [Molorchus minor]
MHVSTLEGLCAIESIMEHIAYSVNLDAADVKMANVNKQKFPKIVKFWNDMQSWAEIKSRKQAIETYNKMANIIFRLTVGKKKGISLVPMAWTFGSSGQLYSYWYQFFHGDGGVVVCHGGIEIGQGINTKV